MGQLEDIQVFLRVVDAGGISRAAEQLNIAKSAVSRRLSELESRLQTKLIQRTTRRFHLTEAGEMYYQKASSVVESAKELDNLLLERSETIEGRLSISIPLSFGLLHMQKAIDEFLRLHPNINLEVDLSDREVNMVEEGIDVAFRIGQLHDSSLQARKIVPIRLMLCASPSYLEKVGRLKKIEDVNRLEFLRYNAEGNKGHLFTGPDGIQQSINPKGRVSSNNGDFLMQMAIAGHGLVILPNFICWQAVQSGKLVEVLPEYQLTKFAAYAIYPQNRFLSKNARTFIDYLVDYFSNEPNWEKG